MRIVFFPKYTKIGPSSRYRIYQYVPYLEYHNIKIQPFFNEDYVPAQSLRTTKGIFYVLKRYVIRLYHMLRLKRDDLVFLQYEFTPYLIFNTVFFKIKKVSYVVDYDDAVFHDYDQHKNPLIRNLLKNKIASVMTNAKAIITGSPYLTEHAQKFSNNVVEIPTSIDFENYKIDTSKDESETFVIGWIGSSTTSFHLRKVLEALHFLKAQQIEFELRLIGYDQREQIDFKDLPVKVIKWDKDH
jgi:glycosyltransferase involved in cell wall biosynthesis